jgi:hypothetical protein
MGQYDHHLLFDHHTTPTQDKHNFIQQSNSLQTRITAWCFLHADLGCSLEDAHQADEAHVGNQVATGG